MVASNNSEMIIKCLDLCRVCLRDEGDYFGGHSDADTWSSNTTLSQPTFTVSFQTYYINTCTNIRNCTVLVCSSFEAELKTFWAAYKCECELLSLHVRQNLCTVPYNICSALPVLVHFNFSTVSGQLLAKNIVNTSGASSVLSLVPHICTFHCQSIYAFCDIATISCKIIIPINVYKR